MIFLSLVLTLIGSFAAQVNAWVLRYTVDGTNDLIQNSSDPFKEGMSLLFYVSALLLIKELVHALIQYGQKFFGEKLRIYATRDLSQAIVDRILTYKMSFFTSPDNQSGKLQTRIDMGISSLTRLIQNFFIDILPLFANAIVALIMMFSANFYVGLVGLVIIPIYFLVSQLQANKLSGFRRRMRTYREVKNNGIISLIDSITVIKSFVREKEEGEKHEKIQYDMTENQLKTRQLSYIFDSVKKLIEQTGVVVIIILTSFLVLKGDMSIGAIMFHILLFNNVSAPIRQLHRIYDEVNDAIIYSEGYFDILHAEDQKERSGTYVPEKVKGNFELTNVYFTYPNGTTALKNINIRIEPDKTTAIVGLSGAGKSTLINLLDRLYEPDSGEICLDDVELKDYNTGALRNEIGIVLQKNHIFKGTIKDNIRYGKPAATDQEIESAAVKAHIHQQIMELPEQYNSDATLLSGGQQQRIAIARLFLKNPAIIFLDEPTASLDAIATEQIKASIDAVKSNRTVIIISHSISQIIDADHLIVMEKGEVVAQGTHEELYENSKVYRDIFNSMVNSLNIEKIAKTLTQE